MTENEAIIQIEHGMFLIKQFYTETSNPLSPIDLAIDRACGRDRDREIVDNTITVLNQIIEGKIFLGKDTSAEKKLIEKLKAL